ncbi:helix-turn-helix domain-containing protein [Serratia marcescens]|jgi:DNA-binding HxlR family transcriptional regulator|uniref:Transcription regulator protein n=2 Tax=Enterobacterales TaxID=91347 RepID=A0A0H3HDR6_KLEM8|nr:MULTISPECIES: helix-turn-helix domain-containing protein [Enterobacterales]EMB2735109.1 helix-turn-helix transcriptional regulator [Serratia marcescens]MCL9641085.1 helix-turn-helix transcriptional regulator [Rahnella victoriana]QHI78910.1 transcriptional regulator [Serratia sp. NGAS9]QMN53406.1 helix-turn-helix transcriptional regulator [Citrobacter freundii]HDH7821838.1 helix-turn-helix transcriptional regulator [Raoultella planticola]HEI6812311.1 helix-turn-helix transcriptional regulat
MEKFNDCFTLDNKEPGNVLREACPAREVLEVLVSKWTLLIIHALSDGASRPGDLRRKIQGISEKVLSQNLKELESRNLVTRTVFREVPPKVEYALTELGTSLWQAANELNRWVEQNCHFLIKDTDPSM